MPPIEEGDIVQINPINATSPMYAGCLMVVTKVLSWGIQGYIQTIGTEHEVGGQVFYRADHGMYQATGGKVIWER